MTEPAHGNDTHTGLPPQNTGQTPQSDGAASAAGSGCDAGLPLDGERLVEAIARRVVELIREDAGLSSAPRFADAAGLAEILGVHRETVYEHAVELGAIPLSDGERPRFRFDVEKAVAAWTARSAGARSQEPVRLDVAPNRGGRRRAASGATAGLLPIRARRAA